MPYPTKYTRQYDFQSYQVSNPTRPLPGNQVNIDLNAVVTSVDELVEFLKMSIRSDGRLANGSVGVNQLDATFDLGFSLPTTWESGVAYTTDSTVLHDNKFYIANVAHTSTDGFDESKWDLIVDFGEQATAAAASATAAAASETAAASSATDASGSATTATAQATAAASSATDAATSETNASTSATAASTSATAAATSETSAAASATAAATSETNAAASAASITFASQAEAEAGVSTTKVMSPLRTAEAIAALAATTFAVADRTAMKALDTSSITSCYLEEDGRAGAFVWRTGDYTTQITADTLEGIYVKATAIASSAGAWVRIYSGYANVKWFGAKGDNSNADLPHLQAATDLVSSVFIPDGTYLTNDAWLLDDYAELRFESRQAIIDSTSTTAIIRPRGHTTSRNFHIMIHGGQINGSGTSGPVGLQLRSASMVKVYGTWITQCNVAVENGGSGAQGAYYNDFFGVDITTCQVGYRNGTLGNEIKVFGGRITDVVVGTDDDDNSGVLYEGVAIETFTTAGHRLANSGSACVDVRSIGCRFENPSGNPSYSSAVGIKVNATAQDTTIIAPGFTTVATNMQDSGVRTQVMFAEDWNQFAGGGRFKTKKRVVINQAIASLAAGATRQDGFAITGLANGDLVSVTLPPSWPSGLNSSPPIVSGTTAYLQLHNPTGSPISMVASDFVFEWTDYT